MYKSISIVVCSIIPKGGDGGGGPGLQKALVALARAKNKVIKIVLFGIDITVIFIIASKM
ncbi:MAG TPA: hypothetical protein VLR29_09520 [Flavobacterium sp.]|nr:hypothetical protein [Flavobacterium sp.]